VDPSQDAPSLLVSSDRGESELFALDELVGGAYAFELSERAVGDLRVNSGGLVLVARQGARSSSAFALESEIRDAMQVEVHSAAGGSVFHNDLLIIRGDGLIDTGEGSSEALFEGTWSDDAGDTPVSLLLPAELVEPADRTRAAVRLGTELGGLGPGDFEGTIRLRQTLLSGSSDESARIDLSLSFQAPTLFALETHSAVLGEHVYFSGGGLVGAPGTDDVTLLRLSGDLRDSDGVLVDFPTTEIVASWWAGDRVSLPLEFEVRDDALVSTLFGLRTGRFEGTVTPILIAGRDELVGDALDFELTIAGVSQQVVVDFLPGYYDSLRHFGLSAAADRVEEVALTRMRTIFSGYGIEFHTEFPERFIEATIARLEVGGPDPNGRGLLGYDNTPGKDVGNLRLFDTIGGANAETQADNFPGYGGVFIESFLYWSSHPDLPGSRPAGAPPAEPLFDDIFDPVRTNPVTLDESRGLGSADRADEAERAISALGNMIGETSAHEVGHSLGLAQPFGSPEAFHSAVPGEGCLMDGGADRPLGERAAEPGYAATRFCGREDEYLNAILTP